MGDIVSSVEIGKRIRRFRLDAGLSQENLAEMVGVTFQQIQKYENGHTTLNILKLQQITKALKLTVADLFEEEPAKRITLSDSEELLLESFRKIKNSELSGCILKLVANVNKRAK